MLYKQHDYRPIYSVLFRPARGNIARKTSKSPKANGAPPDPLAYISRQLTQFHPKPYSQDITLPMYISYMLLNTVTRFYTGHFYHYIYLQNENVRASCMHASQSISS